MGWIPPRIPFPWGPGPPSNTWFHRSTCLIPLKRHLDRFRRFCRAHERDQQTDRQTDIATVCSNRLLSLAIAAIRPMGHVTWPCPFQVRFLSPARTCYKQSIYTKINFLFPPVTNIWKWNVENGVALGGAVAQRVERWTCDQKVVGLNPTRGKSCVTTLSKYVPLSPSSIITVHDWANRW